MPLNFGGDLVEDRAGLVGGLMTAFPSMIFAMKFSPLMQTECPNGNLAFAFLRP
jgi:hypothetical protein